MTEKINVRFEAEEELKLPEHATAETNMERPNPNEVVAPVENVQEKAQEARETISEVRTEDEALRKLNAAQEAENASEPAAAPVALSADTKKISANRQLKGLQRQLPPVQRALSKVIHQPFVSAVSESAGKTVSRPSGLLGGGLLAFVGSSIYVYLAYHMGFTANYLVWLLLFFGGFVLGVFIEVIVNIFLRSRQAD